jgi:hypothetical protein
MNAAIRIDWTFAIIGALIGGGLGIAVLGSASHAAHAGVFLN